MGVFGNVSNRPESCEPWEQVSLPCIECDNRSWLFEYVVHEASLVRRAAGLTGAPTRPAHRDGAARAGSGMDQIGVLKPAGAIL